MTEATLTYRDLMKRLDVSQPTISRMVREGRLPKPIKRPGKPAYWTDKAIDLWFQQFDAITSACETLHGRRYVPGLSDELCELIDMERCDLHFWDDVGVPEEEKQASAKTKGTSAVQFILTSTIVIHTLDLLRAVYVNIFSCKEFDTDEAAAFTAKWFGSNDWTANVVIRR